MRLRVVVAITLLSFTYCFSQQSAQRQSSFPYVSGDSFRAIADHVLDETGSTVDPRRVKQGDVIFVKTDYLEQFFKEIHPAVQGKYILITHNSDYGVPGKFEPFLADEKLHVWFGMSPTVLNHPKFVPIPIGIANGQWPHGDINTFTQFFRHQKATLAKPHLLGINFGANDQSSAHYLIERTRVFNTFSKKSFCTDIRSNKHADYLKKMACTQFVLSPIGNSLDCHRTWEALLVRCIPIVKSSNLDPLFDGLPVLIVKDWDEVTEAALKNAYQEFAHRTFNYEKLFFYYWLKRIEFYRNQIIL